MPTITGTFPVANAQDVHLTVDIGDGQLGRSSVAIRGKEIAAGGEIDGSLGDGDKLRGEALFITSAIKDIRAETNRASVRVTLRCAGVTREFIQADSVKKDGGVIVYVFMIAFK
jgi:hypothetical protein